MRKTIFLSVTLVFLGIVLGVMLVSNISTDGISKLFASEKSTIGAPVAPVQPGEMVRQLNNTLVDVSNAVLPMVVNITVDVDASQNNQNMKQFHDFFKFFGTPDEDQTQRGMGSGVIISPDGYIVTNNHVVENAKSDGIKVTTYDKKEYKAKLIGTDPLTDLAVIKIDGENLKTAHFGEIDSVRIGEMVVAVGNPLGLNSTVTKGIVSAIGRGQIGARSSSYAVQNYIQTDAAINPGNSGGGLFDLTGSLVGINTAIVTENGAFIGYGFAIPIDLVKSVAQDLIDDGKINRGYIGVSIKDVNEALAKAYNLDGVKGVLVQEVMPDGAGKKAGLESGDIILEVEGHECPSVSDLQNKVATYRAGDKVNLTIWRDGKKINKTVTLKPRSDSEDVASNDDSEAQKGGESKDEPVKFDKLGFTIAPVTSQMKSDFSVTHGVFITNVVRYSPAFDRGLFENGVITKADRKEINSTGQLKSMIESKKKGDVLLLEVKYKDRSQIVALEINES